MREYQKFDLAIGSRACSAGGSNTPTKRSEELTAHITVHAMAREGGEEEVSV